MDRPADLRILIHELAHEMKNPMVTIKTFAQLLGDRYQDENFRARFQDVVGNDIERMDDLLEAMIEFADFAKPRAKYMSLEDRARSAFDEIAGEWTKRQATARWHSSGFNQPIFADEAQLGYILRNVLFVIGSQAKPGSEVSIDLEGQGSVVISYLREGPRMASISHYVGASGEGPGESVLPLRMLLAKQLAERNGGVMVVDRTDDESEILRMEFPIA
jgi:light-regulated signal transduction histidine kinase (bacteriophytochrome)